MTTETATDRHAITAESSVELISRATFNPQKICKVYMQKWKNYKTWVDSTVGVARTQNGKYLTRENVDKFFLLEMQYKDHIQPKNLGQFKNSLETYSRNVEYPPPMTPFIVDSPSVQQALEGQKSRYKKQRLGKVGCAHDNLYSDTLSDNDKTILIMFGSQMLTWADYCMSQTCMNQSTMRGDSMRSSRLCDIRLDGVHGPMDSKYPMIGFIQQDYTGKVTSNFKKISGMWRHRNWLFCGTGWLAATILYRLANSPMYADIHFEHNAHNSAPDWYKFEIVSWQGYDAMRSVYRRVYEATSIFWSKCTHMRRQGCDDAGRRGVGDTQMAQQTGHGGSSLLQSYLSDLPPETLTALAGFSEAESYFVERWEIQINNPEYPLIEGRTDVSNEELVEMFLPTKYRRWVDSYFGGVKWKCGRQFLTKVLPFLAMIFVQDGIYRIERFPNHETSLFLFSIFGADRYREWARRQRLAILNIGADFVDQNARVLDRANQDAVISIRSDVRDLTSEFRILRSAIQTKTNESRPASIQAQPSTGTQPQSRQQRMQTSTPRLLCSVEPPLVPEDLPETMEQLVEDHLRLDLEKYERVPKSGAAWTKIKMRLSRRNFLFSLVKKEAETLNGPNRVYRLQEAARRLDVGRQTMSLTQLTAAEKSKIPQEKRNVTPVPGGRKRPRNVLLRIVH
jgi:hypothetical protein